MVTESIDINCPADDVFAYLEQFERHADWQPSLLSVDIQPEGPARPIGTAVVEALGPSSSKVTFSIELEGHGIGRLSAPFALRQTAKEIPQRLRSYKRCWSPEGCNSRNLNGWGGTVVWR